MLSTGRSAPRTTMMHAAVSTTAIATHTSAASNSEPKSQGTGHKSTLGAGEGGSDSGNTICTSWPGGRVFTQAAGSSLEVHALLHTQARRLRPLTATLATLNH